MNRYYNVSIIPDSFQKKVSGIMRKLYRGLARGRTITVVLLLLFLVTPASSAKLKKVLILNFNNIEGNPDYNYLEGSITDAVSKMLRDLFAFKETHRRKVERVARDNFIFKNDYHTKTAAMNLGLLSRQDVVISGGYKVVRDRKSRGLAIVTKVRILDISRKKTLSDFTLKGPADNRLWDSVKKISERISREAEKILPNKEEWKRMGMEDEGESLPLLDNIKMGMAGGVFTYSGGWSKYFQAQQPLVGLNIRGNLPFLWDPLAAQLEIYYLRHTLKEGNDSYVQSIDLQGDTTNYLLGLFCMYEFPLFAEISLYPKLGGGYAYQATRVSGRTSDNFTNSFPFVGGGAMFSYRMNEAVNIALTAQTFIEIENGIYTYLHSLVLGIHFRI
jgi:hypothetical protein